MSAHVKEEFFWIIQMFIGILLALLLVYFLFLISVNYNPFSIIAIAVGSLILYLILVKNKKFAPSIMTIVGMSIAFSFIFLVL